MPPSVLLRLELLRLRLVLGHRLWFRFGQRLPRPRQARVKSTMVSHVLANGKGHGKAARLVLLRLESLPRRAR